MSAGELTERLREYAKDWRTRAADASPPIEAADVIEALRKREQELVEALYQMCGAAEYWAGCDEDCTPDVASSEIMSSGGAWPSVAYDRARRALQGASQ